MAVWMVAATSAYAKLELEAEAGFGGTFVSGAWIPMRALIQNMPDPTRPEAAVKDFTGEIRAKVIGSDGQAIQFVQPLEMPAHSRKIVELPIQVPHNQNPILVYLVDAKGRENARAEVKFAGGGSSSSDKRDQFFIRPTVLVQSDPNQAVSFPTSMAASANIQQLPLEEFPHDALGYQAVRVVFIHGRLSGKLKDDQLAAFEGWLDEGGQLVVATARSVDEIKLDAWLKPRLPAIPETANEATLEGGDKKIKDKTLQTVWGDLAEGAAILWGNDAGPVLLKRAVGLGAVYAIGMDTAALTGLAAHSPEGLQVRALHDALLAMPRIEDVRARHIVSTANVEPNFRVDMLPNRMIVAMLMVFFVVVVGPLNFYILRRMRRLELAWFTIPALSIFFFVAVYIFGLATKGSRQFFASAEILHLTAGRSKGLLVWMGSQFSPSSRGYRLSSPSGGTVLPYSENYSIPNYGGMFANIGASAFGITADPDKPGSAIRNREAGYDLVNPVGQWEMEFYHGERPLEIEGKIEGGVRIEAGDGDEGDVTTVHIKNATAAKLENAEAFVGQVSYRLGDIAPGAELSLSYNNEGGVIESRSQWKQGEAPDTTTQPTIPSAASAVSMGPTPDPQERQQQMQQGLKELQRKLEGDMTAAQPKLQDAKAKPAADYYKDKFSLSVSENVRDGAINRYPLYPMLNPQRRCRLIARQTEWLSGVKIDPEPEEYKTAGMIEIELPLEIKGEVAFSSSPNMTRNRLRMRVADYDPDAVAFFDNPGDFCTLNNGSVEVVFAPPALAHPVQFVQGKIGVNFTGAPERFVLKIFNYDSGDWGVLYAGDTAVGVERKPTNELPITAGNVNPYGHFIRVRLESRELPATDEKKKGMFANESSPFLNIHGITARLYFTDMESR